MSAMETITYQLVGDCHSWQIHDQCGEAAELLVSVALAEILNVEVRSDRRREGLARALHEAATTEMAVYHAPPQHRSPEGDAFARAVGGPTIEAYPCDCHACNEEGATV